MSRNEGSRFALAPQVDIQRSRFPRNSNLKTSFNVGDLVPIYVDEVLPGDTWSMKTSKVLRLETLKTPVMDNLYFDVYYFFVPNRLVWSHWKELMGENNDSAWIPTVEYSVPYTFAPANNGWNIGTVADYMGIPTGVDGDVCYVNSLPLRGYALICNEWFRDQNLQSPINITLNDNDTQGVNTGNYITDLEKGGLPFKANKFHDYFTSALPSPMKHDPVTIPMSEYAPVLPYDKDHMDKGGYYADLSTVHNLYLNTSTGLLETSSNKGDLGVNSTLNSRGSQNVVAYNSSGTSMSTYPVPVNLYANLSAATAVSINQLRLAFQIQKIYETDARSGTRYTESVRAHFGVTSPDARLQRPEYLGGNRFPFNVQQVSQTSSTDSTTPQGNLAGFSVTADVNHDFTFSSSEHGFIIGLACARYEHSYQQGLERFWTRNTRFDYYFPALAHIGETPVYSSEIYLDNNTDREDVFGYQEAWADYRYKPSKITGQMRSAANGALDSWHFADNYASQPYLSDTWIAEDKSNIDRALAVTSAVSNQIFGDLYFECTVTRPMPLYSVPGLIDHF